MLIKIRPPYKVRMHQDQARTRAHDTYGTITQHLPFQKKIIKQSYSLSIFLCSSSALSYIYIYIYIYKYIRKLKG